MWTLPADWLTTFQGFASGATSGFMPIVLWSVGVIIAIEVIFNLIDIADMRRQDASVWSMSDIAREHAGKIRREALEKEYRAFGISDIVERIEETKAVREAEAYRERVKKIEQRFTPKS